jgi:hypothetical protein
VSSVSVLPTGMGGNDGCEPLADYGIKVAVKYQVNDQNGQPIKKGNLRPQEKVLNRTCRRGCRAQGKVKGVGRPRP